MNMTCSGKIKSTRALKEAPLSPLTVPARELSEPTLAVGLRQNMVDMEGLGEVNTGSGLGSDWIELRWGEKTCVLRGSELLRAWVATFAPKDAARFPEEVRVLP